VQDQADKTQITVWKVDGVTAETNQTAPGGPLHAGGEENSEDWQAVILERSENQFPITQYDQ